MMAKIIDGKKIAADVRNELKPRIDRLAQNGCTPRLSVILVGHDPASEVYVRMKTKACQEMGIASETIGLEADVAQRELIGVVRSLNENRDVHGILVQLPLPPQIDEQRVLDAVDPRKDVDGFHPFNRGRLAAGDATFVPCTPLGIQELLLRSGYPPERKHVVIVGRSNIVGLPLANILVQKRAGANATVTVCHTGTQDIAHFTRQADILVAAVGRPEFIGGDMVKQGAVVVDVGVNRVEDLNSEKGYHLVGDVAFEAVAQRAAAITPVPGGVGPMTIAMLLGNTLLAAEKLCASSSIG
ncbi:MAG: bifunctional 5,10-methylenetetrahydrofolate dehydrogenase/5,10-methenyltetrahydrofolate cyclohydrolase [Calditrichaeota bacterium]|nr:MAG: bifunctional 5,10-methylenetetrahydrofolate dehydrogenase/5,10-methenyltetrahydrofolate cyclohydrolase [Calditrichota bacterium]